MSGLTNKRNENENKSKSTLYVEACACASTLLSILTGSSKNWTTQF